MVEYRLGQNAGAEPGAITAVRDAVAQDQIGGPTQVTTERLLNPPG